MANKSSTIIVRIEPDIKSKAEAIMNNLGLPVSVVINALYHQIIYTNSIPFPLTLPERFITEDEIGTDRFNQMMEMAVAEASNGEGDPADEVLERIRKKLKNV